MAPKKSKVKKPKVKKRVTKPAKGIIERTICAHPMLKRVQKEVRELKKKSAKRHKKYRLRLSFFATFPPIPRHGDSLKISEDSRKTSSIVIWFAFVYPCVSTEDPEEQKCYFSYYYIKEKYNIKKSSGSSGTSRTYTQLNQNTGKKTSSRSSSNFTVQSSGSSGNTSSK